MIFIVEGIDKAGKSTIARGFLELNSNMCYIKRKVDFNSLPKDKEGLVKYLNNLREITDFVNDKKHFKHVLLDRFHASEGVYSAVKRNFDSMETPELWKMDDYLADKAILIYVKAPLETLIYRMEKESEEYVRTNEINLLLERYERFLDATRIPCYVLDGTKNNEKRIREIIAKYDGVE